MKRFLRAALAAVCFALVAAPVLDVAIFHSAAFAQTTVTSTAPSETTINVGQLLAPWLQALIAGLVTLVTAAFGWLTVVINKRAGLESNAAVLQMEAHARELLETALTNAAGMVVMKAGPALDGMVIDVKSPLIAQGVMQVNVWAQSAVQKFGLTPDDLAKKLINKIGVITAANPAVTPTTTGA